MTLAFGISAYSLMEGIYLPEDLARLALHLGYTDLALVDRGLHGFPRMRETAEKVGLRLHVGCRLPLLDGEVFVLPLDIQGYGAMNKALTDFAHGRTWSWPEHCLLLADRWGVALPLRDQAPRPDLIVILIGNGGWQVAQRARAEGFAVAGPQILRFFKPEGLAIHKTKRAIAMNVMLQDLKPKDYWEPRLAARTCVSWEQALSEEVNEGTRRVESHLQGWNLPWGRWVLPNPPHLSPGEDVAERLWSEAREGTRRRYGALPDSKVQRRIEFEMDLILRKGFGGYFLTMQAITQNASRTCGRGSGAASLLSYLLGITNVDPVGANLMFERFLNEDREDPPDLDVDFAWDERDGVLQWVFETFGREHVAMVANHNMFQPRGAIREVAKLHCRPESEISRMSKRLRTWGWEDEAGLQVNLGRTSRADAPMPEPWPDILQMANRLVGQPHLLSVHPGGTVITPGPLWEHAPSQPRPVRTGATGGRLDRSPASACSPGFPSPPVALQHALEVPPDVAMAKLMDRTGQLLVGLPAVPVEDTGIPLAQQILHLFGPPARQETEGLCICARRHPQPHAVLPAAPEAGLVRMHHRRLLHFRVDGLHRLRGCLAHGLTAGLHRAQRDPHTEQGLAQAHHLAPRHPVAPAQQAHLGLHPGTERTRGRAFGHPAAIDVAALQAGLSPEVELLDEGFELWAFPDLPDRGIKARRIRQRLAAPLAGLGIPVHHLIHLGLWHQVPRLSAVPRLPPTLPATGVDGRFPLAPQVRTGRLRAVARILVELRLQLRDRILVELRLQLRDPLHRGRQQRLQLLDLALQLVHPTRLADLNEKYKLMAH